MSNDLLAKKYPGLRPGHNPGAGRPKGVPNRWTKEAKDVISEAASRMGGVDRLVEWAQSSPKREDMFWSVIYPKMLPINVHGDTAKQKLVRIERVILRETEPGVVVDVTPQFLDDEGNEVE